MLHLGLRWSRRRDDGPTREAKRFRAALGRCRDDSARRRLADRMPGVGGASAISTGPPPLRWAVEARLLAGEPIAAIASKLGMTVEVITWYEALFFNVCDRLLCRSYVVHAVIGPAPMRGIDPGDEGAFLKFLGYHGGPAVLDLAIAAMWPALPMSGDEEAARGGLERLRLALTPITPARAARRETSPGEAEQRLRLAASGRRKGQRSADPPPPGVPIGPIELTDNTGP